VTLYEMLFGKPPFGGKDVYEITAKANNGKLAPPRECDQDGWNLVLSMLVVNPEQRVSMSDVLNAEYVFNGADAVRGFA
jgi:serine/threonine protein kinase